MFRPPLWLRHGHVQTLAASQVRRRWPPQRRCRQIIELADGSQLRLLRLQVCAEAPTLVVLHGMGGSTDSGYVRGLAAKASRRGWNVAAVDLYNLNPDLSRPRIFHAGCSRDYAEILQRSGLLAQPLVLIGVSLGGNILLKLLGEWGRNYPQSVLGAAALSPLVDLEQSWPLLDRPSSWIYRRHFVSRLRRLVSERAALWGRFVDLERLARVHTIREYDEVVTAPLGGFACVDDYYRQASARPLLARIRVPTAVIHSRDDPLLPWKLWTEQTVLQNPFLAIALQRRGGHVGFLQSRRRRDSDRWWAEHRLIEFLERTIEQAR